MLCAAMRSPFRSEIAASTSCFAHNTLALRPDATATTTSTIGEILPVAARRFGARTALIVGDRSFSFADLESLSNRIANGLSATGVQPAIRKRLGYRLTASWTPSGGNLTT